MENNITHYFDLRDNDNLQGYEASILADIVQVIKDLADNESAKFFGDARNYEENFEIVAVEYNDETGDRAELDSFEVCVKWHDDDECLEVYAINDDGTLGGIL